MAGGHRWGSSRYGRWVCVHLIKKLFVVLDDFDAAELVGFQVQTLHGGAEGGSTQVIHDLVSSSDDTVDLF